MFAITITSLLFSAILSATEATTVAVLEYGKGGVTRRITSASPVTSVAGVSSFWKSVHEDPRPSSNKRRTRATQYPGMTVVPDLFRRANGGIAIGLVGGGIDLSSMPTLARVLQEGGGAVGHFHVNGNQAKDLMTKAGASKAILSSSLDGSMGKIMDSVTSQSSGNKLAPVLIQVDDSTSAAALDQKISEILQSLEKKAIESDSTFLVHIVIDTDSNEMIPSRRQLASRELRDENNNNNNNNQNNKNQAQNGQNGQSSMPYGVYAVTNEYNEVITNYRTIFQIQYFNVVLWTALGLCLVVFIAVMMMVNMPFMPDTLLFGESAKMVAE